MLENAKKKILNGLTRMPPPVGRALLHLKIDPGKFFGHGYREYKKFLAANRVDFSPEPILIKAVNHAINHIPWYRERYGDQRISTIAQFKEYFGFIDKEVVLGNFDQFVDPSIDKSSYDTGTTGGTSGKPLRLIAPKNRYVVELATMHSLWEQAGYRFHVRAVIRNHRLGEYAYFVNPIMREVIFDGFRLTDDYFSLVYRTIRKMGIRFVHCYPSTAYEFSSFIYRNHLDSSVLEAFLSGSENIFDYQRKLIRETLGIRFFNWYGHSEKLLLGGYCAGSDLYHMEPTYGFFELVDEHGIEIREPGKVGEIVGTAFHNPGMPLIRYRTGDFAEFVSDRCEACGRNLPVIGNIRGRWSGERIYNSDGSFITTTALNLHNDLYEVINGLQYVQKKRGELTVLIVKSPGYTVGHETALRAHFRDRLASGTRVEIQYVELLRRKPNGKFVQLLSLVQD